MAKVPELKLPHDDGEYCGKFRILLAGFKRQTIVSLDEVVSALQAVPDFHLQGLEAVRYDPLRMFQRLETATIGTPMNFMLRGEFYRQFKALILYAFSRKSEFLHLLYHELGHFVFYRQLSDVERKRWVVELFPGSHHVSDYARDNANEDFAESYAWYVMSPLRLTRLEEKYTFIHEVVFRGTTPRRGEKPTYA